MILPTPVADLLKIEDPLRKMRQHFLGSSKEQLGTINRSGHKLVPATRPLDIEQDCSFRMHLEK